MKTTKRLMTVKLLAVVVAFIVAIGVLFGGVISAAAQEGHRHTFATADNWTKDYKNHWHAATCGCTDTVKDMAPHTYNGSTCSVCGMEKPTIDPANHVHTFEAEWSYDDDHHWYAADCEHNIVKDIAPHVTSGTCVCGKVISDDTTDPGTEPGTNPGTEPGGEVEAPKEPAEIPAGIDRAGGYNESFYAEWTTDKNTDMKDVSASYQLKGASSWTPIDKELIRLSGTTARVDAVGLKAGEYNLKIEANGNSLVVKGITVTAHDRSGYAHFKYTGGVGAYKDDGTLKDNALVIYVTEENKDTVMKDVVAANSDLTMFKVPYSGQGKNWGDKDADGIGWWLNNCQYTMNNTSSKKNKRPSNTYDAANGSKYGFKIDRPVAIRFLGTVTVPEGCTAKGSEDEGGSVDDNGCMARMRNYKNITIEGIGEDATILGWGFHFMAGTDAVNGQGKSFEVRNLTFDKYPEDAIGMEGQATSTKITGPVERCWVHNNVFHPGYCANPMESDKGEGDGSCDFKRGEYFTLSYNYFNDCHKTNLVGSSDSSLQFNITMHHNWWNNCGSRMPLTRQANVHFYNNYLYGDPNGALSYVSSLRANCLLFSECNYYDGSKNVTDKKAGMGVAYGNIYYAISGENEFDELSARDEKVTGSNCAYDGVSYADFYINSTTFYYDASAKKSNCLLDNAATARKRVMMYSGVNGFGKSEAETKFNENEPENAVSVPDNGTLTIDLAQVNKGANTVVSNVLFTGITGKSSGLIKGKGQLVTFTLSVDTQVDIEANGSAGNGELVRADGVSYGHNFGTFSGILPAGTYIIASSVKGKELNITKIAFTDSGNSSELRISAAEDAINAIGEVMLESGSLINAANRAYNALTANEKTNFNGALKAKLDTANSAYETLIVNNAIAKINDIGTVNEDSYNKITTARAAYNMLTSAQKAKVTNANVLDAAIKAFSDFAVKNVDKMIEALPNVSDIDIGNKDKVEEAVELYEKARQAYYSLDDGIADDDDESGEVNQQAQVKAANRQKLLEGIPALAKLEKLFEFKEMLDVLEKDTVTIPEGATLKTLYEGLSDAQKGKLTAAEKTKYDEIIQIYTDLASKAKSSTFIGGQPSDSAFKHSGTKQSAKKSVFTVHAYSETETLASGLKFESSTELTLTLEVKMTVTLYFNGANSFKIDGNEVQIQANDAGDYVLTVTLEAGEHKLSRWKSEVSLYYATLVPSV